MKTECIQHKNETFPFLSFVCVCVCLVLPALKLHHCLNKQSNVVVVVAAFRFNLIRFLSLFFLLSNFVFSRNFVHIIKERREKTDRASKEEKEEYFDFHDCKIFALLANIISGSGSGCGCCLGCRNLAAGVRLQLKMI